MRLTLCRGALATLALGLAMAGCNQDASPESDESGASAGKVGAIAGKLTLPDNSQITSVHFAITQMGSMYSKMGDVPVGNSTVLTFRVGGIPVGNGYNIKLDGDTSFNNHCTGNANFDIVNNQTTRVTVVISCGATDNEADLIVDGEFVACPIIKSIQAIPGETTLGNAIMLESTISHGMNPVVWTGSGGTFGTPNAYATAFTCEVAGPHTLTVAVNTAACHDSRTVDVTCTLGAGCGNGQLDAGEQCDDGNTVNTDACSNACRTPACGDGMLQMGEECDDNNTVNGDACSATCTSIVCGNNRVDPGEQCDDGNTVNNDSCTNTCRSPGCGDGVQQTGEECDDGNSTNTDACSNACTNNICGNNRVDPGEACDDGNTASGDGCSPTCTVEDACATCRNASCQNYQGANWVLGCFNSGATGDAARNAVGVTLTPAQVQACVDAVACADLPSSMNCAYNSLNPVNPCYCGIGTTVDFCNNAANPATGPCKTAFEAAAGSTVRGDVLLRMNDITYPTGWAYFLFECDRLRCNAQCAQ